MIQSKWWEVGRIIPYDFVMYDLYFCHFKTYEILHSALRHPVTLSEKTKKKLLSIQGAAIDLPPP